jgi:dephospho-CoA kinase
VIIGLTGRNAAGKGTVADWLRAQGFAYTSLSDAIRAWLAEQGKPASRDNLIWGGRTLRQAGGPGVLAERTLPLLADGRDWVVDSIRNPAEVAVLRRCRGFRLVEVAAREEVRWQRLQARGRAGDARDFEEFRRQEGAELASGDQAAQQLVATSVLADVVVSNDGDAWELHARMAGLVREWSVLESRQAGPTA